MKCVRTISVDDGAGWRFVEDFTHEPRNAVVEKLDGWFDGAEIEQTKVKRLGDGMMFGRMWRTERAFTVGVWQRLQSEQEVVATARGVSGAFPSGMPEGTITVADEWATLTAEGVRLDGRPKVEHQRTRGLWVRWELPLVASDPFLYGAAQETTAFTRTAGTGLEYLLFDDQDTGEMTGVLEFGEPLPAALTLTNEGNAPAFPVIEVVGEMAGGFDLRLFGDRHGGPGRWGVTYRGDVRDRSPVVVDMAGSVTVAGRDQTWAAVSRDWAGVAPGGSVTLQLRALSGGSGGARMTLRSTYL